MSSAALSESEPSSIELENELKFSLTEVHRFIKDCLQAIGTPPNHAEAVAKSLTQADYRGHTYEGLNQLETYVEEIAHGGCNKDAVPRIIKESAATAWVDGCNGIGVVVGNFCMDLAIKKAKSAGIGWVVAKGSSNFGFASNYCIKALNEGLLGMCLTNSTPLVAPSRALDGVLGTNPISMSAPALHGDSFLLDIATASVSVGKIELLSRERLPVPSDWANPETGALRPMGGNEPETSFKGFGLALLVEIFCGILSDSAYGPNIRKYGNYAAKPNLGHCFVAINPSFFAPGFETRLSDLLNFLRKMRPADPSKPVLVPGDTERQHMAMVDQQGGIPYVRHLLRSCSRLAERLNVEPLNPLT